MALIPAHPLRSVLLARLPTQSMADYRPSGALHTLSLCRNRLLHVEGLEDATGLRTLHISHQRGLAPWGGGGAAAPAARAIATGAEWADDDEGEEEGARGLGWGARQAEPQPSPSLGFDETSMAAISFSLASLRAAGCGLRELWPLLGLSR